MWNFPSYQLITAPFSFFRSKFWESPLIAFSQILFPIHQEILLTLFSKHIQTWSVVIISTAPGPSRHHFFSGLLQQSIHWSPCIFLHLLFSTQQPECVTQLRWWPLSASNTSIVPCHTQSKSQSPEVVFMALRHLLAHTRTLTTPPVVCNVIHGHAPHLTHSTVATLAVLMLEHARRVLGVSLLSGSSHRLVPLLKTFSPDDLQCQILSFLSCLCLNITFSIQLAHSTWTLHSLNPALSFSPNT